jgi:hypothetical protein
MSHLLTQNLSSAEGPREKPSWRAIRISQIPSSILRDEFVDILQELNEGGGGNVLSWSYCPDATSCYEERYNVATVALREIPQFLSNSGCGTWQTKLGTFATDINFLGLTPMSTSARENTTVE